MIRNRDVTNYVTNKSDVRIVAMPFQSVVIQSLQHISPFASMFLRREHHWQIPKKYIEYIDLRTFNRTTSAKGKQIDKYFEIIQSVSSRLDLPITTIK
jgi:hypothetical protein